jgi:hypothetical protein
MNTFNKIGLLCGLISFFAFTAPVIAGDQFGDEWKISISGDAVTAGSISFILTFEPDNDGNAGDPITIDTQIAANTSKEDMVSLIGNSFSTALGENDFDVDISWGEQIEVAAEEDTPNFALTVARNTLQGISIKIKE